ncbi:MAG: metallophosphoesterase family protein [Planctomycetaceae bacterium]|nr:metallophosphoesterase family protein [Planctomycetaceae bacterium]
MDMTRTFVLAVAILVSAATNAGAGEEFFRVFPYVQNPTPEAISILWISPHEKTGCVKVLSEGEERRLESQVISAEALRPNPFAPEPGVSENPSPLFKHRVRVEGLKPETTYSYTVEQGTARFNDTFTTAPSAETPIRFIVYSDSETEPESSTSPPVEWPVGPGSNRPEGVTRYVVDQTIGYRENLKVIDQRRPNFICIVGDLVESGGEQRDWDEFWRHNAGEYNTLAGHIPIFAAPGNHENFGGPGGFGGYSAEAANFGVAKFLTYFEVPSNDAEEPAHRGRYYRVNYGPIALISVDSSDGLPHGTAADTNHNLSGSNAPDFNPGSAQYRWIEQQLADAQKTAKFQFVQFHHTMYGSGPHSVPFGHKNFSGQSGIAMRVLEPLFHRYGVDAVLSGHDEMLERSKTVGVEVLPDGTERAHAIHFYDVGLAGDGLRGSSAGFDNPARQFLAHDNSAEVWEGRRLVSGGKHYGHLEINIAPNREGIWQAIIAPVHNFPLMNGDGSVVGWERRQYDDVVTIRADQ